MKIKNKTWSILAIIFSTITIISISIYFLGYVNLNFVIVILGLSQLFSGISQIELASRINSNPVRKRNKNVGILLVIIGCIISTMSIVEILQ